MYRRARKRVVAALPDCCVRDVAGRPRARARGAAGRSGARAGSGRLLARRDRRARVRRRAAAGARAAPGGAARGRHARRRRRARRRHAHRVAGARRAPAAGHAARARPRRRAGVDSPVCQVANYLFPACKVLAGDEEALRFLEARGGEFGLRRSARVRVEGAFHTPLMAGAEAALREALRAVEVRAPRVRVWCCAEAAPYRDAAGVRRGLARHVTRAVRWEQTLQALYARPRDQHFPLTLTLGPGGALRSTLRQVNARAWDASLQIDV
ncbi:unnamed protein product [Chrysodeixis includens]|uniref:Malonyl-CoA:ACP transacylase (MAT) domain-containing protein n=1 Tax=Chrysodeixis includens TaxID=689277 RepID=A0A9P0BRY8_CHRIL|nr:unnamed protein product [Chrysodeixis includens]